MYWFEATIIATLPLLLGELFYRAKLIQAESSRKLVHVLGSISAVLLCLVLDLRQIAILCLGFTVILVLIRRTRLVGALYDIKRRSFGEILFPAGIGATALIAHDTTSYVFSILVLGFADAGASLIGKKYGHSKFKPRLSQGSKTYIGSAAFFAITFTIGMGFLLFQQDISSINLVYIFLVSLVITFAESQLSYGLDNFILPILSVMLIQVIIVR